MTEVAPNSLRSNPFAIVEPSLGCCSEPIASPSNGTLFHFSLNVGNLERSIAFYRILFGVEPAKHHSDYAKFELSQPPLVFSLVPNPPSFGGSLSHFGFPVASVQEVEAVAARLAAAGLEISCQQGTVCGYARQDKVWVADPDRNFWEIYVVHEDVDPETVRSSFDGPPQRIQTGPPSEERSIEPATIWEHRILAPLPDRIGHDDATVNEVRLEGLFNDAFGPNERRHLLTDSLRVLCPGGRLLVHGLVADRPLEDERPELPGVAALVSRVPVIHEPLEEIAMAGFVAVRITKLPPSPVFQHGSCEMREVKIEARKPELAKSAGSSPRAAEYFVLYRGPFAQAVDEDGAVFRRGHRTQVSPQAWERVARSPAASQFIFFGDPTRDDRACG